MSTKDISRFLFQPRKHYVGMRMQQGRVLLDSDHNEGAWHEDEDQRRTLLELIGPQGSPDGGFFIGYTGNNGIGGTPQPIVGDVNPGTTSIEFNDDGTTIQVPNYYVMPGSMYVGGMRVELEEPEHIAFQSDYLQNSPILGDIPSDLSSSATVTHHFFFLNVWEQCVTAVEDEEFLERALGGPDTSVRVRRMRRVEFLLAEEGEDCITALERALDVATDGMGQFVRETGELRSPGRLWIDFTEGDTEDTCAPCHPDPTGRYLGAENQAIRIMLVEPTLFVWAFDNAAPLYRVTIGGVSEDPGAGNDPVVTMLTLPKDEEHWPLEGRVVEILPWSAILENGEKVADEIGVFCRVSRSFEPDGENANTFLLDPSDTAAMGALNDLVHAWDNDHPRLADLDPGDEPRQFYVRFWHQAALPGTPVLIPTTSTAPLGSTGLIPIFTQPGLRGDFWIAALRPETPDRIVPLDLHTNEVGVPPHGPRHFFAPLAMIHSAQNVVTDFEDCRRRIIPVTNHCCTITVADGVHSFGQYRTIQAALNALPPHGGRICVKPGFYPDPVVISERTNVVIEGCRDESVIDGTVDADDPMITIHEGSSNITIQGLTVRTSRRPAFEIRSATDVTLRDLVVDSATTGSAPTNPLIRFFLVDGIVLESSQIVARGRVAVFLRNITRARLRKLDVTSTALAGVAFACCSLEFAGAGPEASDSLSAEVEVSDSVFQTFGSTEHATVVLGMSSSRFSRNVVRGTFGSGWGGVHVLSGVDSLEISDNLIEGGKGHGITLASVVWTDDTGAPSPPFIRLPIGAGQVDAAVDGHLTGSFRNGFPFGAPTFVADLELDANGGQNIVITGNVIRGMGGNGISSLTIFGAPDEIGNAERIPHYKNLRIERNRIHNNVAYPTAEINIHRDAPLPIGGSIEGSLPGHEADVADLPFGGIVLAATDGLEIRDNVIEANGTGAFGIPMCGIFVLSTTRATISDNRIVDNGHLLTPAETSVILDPGIRAGIAIPLAGLTVISLNEIINPFSELTAASLLVGGNIVHQLEGRALFLVGTGAMTVSDNALSGRGFHGSSALVDRFAMGDVVHIQNHGAPVETLSTIEFGQISPSLKPLILQQYLENDSSPGATGFGLTPRFIMGVWGHVEFTDNQVVLDWVVARHDPTPPEGEEVSVPLSFAPVAVISVDHVAVKDNRFALKTDFSAVPAGTPKHLGPPADTSRFDPRFLLTHVLALGGTVDASGNRIAEGFDSTDVSLVSIGLLANLSVFNQSSHCVVSYEPASYNAPLNADTSTNDFVKEGRFRIQDGSQTLFPPNVTAPACSSYYQEIQGDSLTELWTIILERRF